MSTLEELTNAGVAAEAAEGAIAAIAAGPAAVIVNHHPAVDAPTAVTALAATLTTDPLDIHHATPEGDRWTAEEIRARVLTPAHVHPYDRNHIVIADTPQATPAIHTTLLKTIEEPPTPTTFWLCAATNTTTLPATLRGRVATTINLPRASDEDLTRHLVKHTSTPREQAAETLAHANYDLALATAAITHGATDTLARVHTHTWRTTTPQATADALLIDLAALARITTATRKITPTPPTKKGTAARVDLPKLTPPQRARLRSLTRATLTSWEADVVADALHTPSRASVARARAALRTIDEARIALAWNASVATVLASALTGLNTLPTP